MNIIKSTYTERGYHLKEFPYCVKVFLLDRAAYSIYFIHNTSTIRDSTGYSPAYLVNPAIDIWLRKYIGVGQRGMALPGEKNYVNRLSDQKWWHGWSYSHDEGGYHYIYIHFANKHDALAFKMVWG